ncbi:hypothetical protein DRO61_09870 [Candidatus Bathyarchaeota archaeon]|nr:MAG: hypothetical protein DRO61_09870 [Candidatus Bathyarchaeota archaeon]
MQNIASRRGKLCHNTLTIKREYRIVLSLAKGFFMDRDDGGEVVAAPVISPTRTDRALSTLGRVG